jgi:hypothetical protein
MAEITKDSPGSLLPRRIVAVTDYEITNGVLKFFKAKGLIRKKIVVVREIPIHEIGTVESYWNELSVSWNGFTNIFIKKNSYESFTELRDKILLLLEEHKKNELNIKKFEDLKKELLVTTNSLVPVIDVFFDMLRGLHAKRVDWKQENEYSNNIGKNLIIANNSIPPIALDFTEVAEAARLESSTKVATECRKLLRYIYEYFQSLDIEDDSVNKHPHVRDAFNLIELFYCINDVFLGKVVKDKDNSEEFEYIEKLTQQLSADTNFKIELDELMTLLNKFDTEKERENIVKDTRQLVKIQLTQFWNQAVNLQATAQPQ